jgi:sialate O-acetylesterase
MIENAGFVSTNDLVGPEEAKTVHPKLKLPIGERLANSALKQSYGKDTICTDFAAFDFLEVKDDKAIVTFKKIEGGLTIESQPELNADSLIGFEIAGEDHVFYPADAVFLPYGMNGTDRIEVNSSLVTKPQAVRYSFKTYAVGNVRNGCGLPLIPFRTDNWEE